MSAEILTNQKATVRRKGRVSSKRQLTIPKEFCDQLHIEKDVEMILEGNALIIKPVAPPLKDDFDDFSDLILKSIVEEDFISRSDILTEFRKRKEAFRLGGKDFLDDMVKQAMKDTRTSEDLDQELFGDLDDA